MRGLPTRTVLWRMEAKREAYAWPRTKDAAAGTRVGCRVGLRGPRPASTSLPELGLLQTVWEPDAFARLFQLLLSQYDVGTIPPVLDAVQVGAVSAQRLHQQKHLFVLGVQEGKLPGYSGSNGISDHLFCGNYRTDDL